MKTGFTLVEVMVALAVLTIGILGLLSAVAYVARNNFQNLAREEAVRILSEELDSLRHTNYSEIDNSTLNCIDSFNCTKLLSGSYTNCFEYRLIRTMNCTFAKFYQVEESEPGVKKVTVYICWGSPENPRWIKAETVITQQ